MNIAYSLKLLGHDVVPFVFVGKDFDKDYQEHLNILEIDQSGIHMFDDSEYSSKCFIFTDPEGNQFTGFYPGPARIPKFEKRLENFINQTFDYAIIAPDIPENMIDTARVLTHKKIPFLGDPGQGVTDFTPSQCADFISVNNELILNAFEFDTLSETTDLDRLSTLVVTNGKNETRWFGIDPGAEKPIPTKIPKDPTGCGDAFRAGWVHARLSGASIRDSVRLGAVLATINMESTGSQSHSIQNLDDRYLAAWKEHPQFLNGLRPTK